MNSHDGSNDARAGILRALDERSITHLTKVRRTLLAHRGPLPVAVLTTYTPDGGSPRTARSSGRT